MKKIISTLKTLLLALICIPYFFSLFYLMTPPVSTLMYWHFITFQKVERSFVPLSKMSPNLVRAVITAEDGAFCSHWGVDFKQMEKSVDKAMRYDRPVKGTSTISQQLAKNLFLWHGRSWVRKALEFPLALWLELLWPKWKILEAYLNVVEWGDGVYGAEAAARHHFGVSAKNLTQWQAALLATSLPNPTQRSAGRPGPAQAAMAGTVVARMNQASPDFSCLR